jgi:hypothetical protein
VRVIIPIGLLATSRTFHFCRHGISLSVERARREELLHLELFFH